MAKKYTCGVCDETFMGDRESLLVQRVRSHASGEHDAEIEENEIRQEIIDT